MKFKHEQIQRLDQGVNKSIKQISTLNVAMLMTESGPPP